MPTQTQDISSNTFQWNVKENHLLKMITFPSCKVNTNNANENDEILVSIKDNPFILNSKCSLMPKTNVSTTQQTKTVSMCQVKENSVNIGKNDVTDGFKRYGIFYTNQIVPNESKSSFPINRTLYDLSAEIDANNFIIDDCHSQDTPTFNNCFGSGSNSHCNAVLKNVGVVTRCSIVKRFNEDDLSGIDVKTLKKNYLENQQKPNNRKTKESSNRNLNISRCVSVKNLEMEKDKFCHGCKKAVYKMEEAKAEGLVWHKNCFRCSECGKQLSVDNYIKNTSLYCKVHFKLLFGPKVADSTIDKPAKPELIIRENQPVELPPGVVRASDKADLGLEELQQLNVRSRFQVFEKPQEDKNTDNIDKSVSNNNVKRSASIMSKLAKFQAKGMNTGVSDDDLHGIKVDNSSTESLSEDDEEFAEGDDPDLIRAKRAQKERPMSFNNMNDIKTKFENGNIMSREGRREERKQEIQNIRSRLFMGKQARIKEMYQAAVAESENGKTSTGKKPDFDVTEKARSIKEKFETGAIFKFSDDEVTASGRIAFSQDEEMGVFESGISKKSRSIFMEMDASASKNVQMPLSGLVTQRTPESKNRQSFPPVHTETIVKCDEKADEVKIETSEIVSKFKFFETYKPSEQKKKVFRITPPRDGVVKMPTTEAEEIDDQNDIEKDDLEDDSVALVKSHTTTKMLSMFREMEQNKRQPNEAGLKPLKRFTPPPDEQRRLYAGEESDNESLTDGEEECDEEEDDDEIDEDEEAEDKPARYEDDFLNQAQSAARAKLLRDKFEKWEANEIRREMLNENNGNGTINIYTDDIEENQIESTKSLRAKFENMKESEKEPTRPKYQINRFV